MKYPVHPDYKNLNVRLHISVLLLPLLKAAARSTFRHRKIPSGLEHSAVRISGGNNGRFSAEVFDPFGKGTAAPVLLFLHGGAFVLPAAAYHKRLICDYALEAGCKVVFADYRLAPEFPYPRGLEDCVSAYHWILENAGEYGFLPEKIGLCGDSAGGALAAGLAQILRDRGGRRPLFQMLVYPVLDSEMKSRSMRLYRDSPVWNSVLNRKMWKLYLKNRKDQGQDSYASPLSAESLTDLPPAYIEVNEFDCLKDEGIAYARRLEAAGTAVEFHENAGAVHGFEVNYESPYTRSLVARRIRFMKEKFSMEAPTGAVSGRSGKKFRGEKDD